MAAIVKGKCQSCMGKQRRDLRKAQNIPFSFALDFVAKASANCTYLCVALRRCLVTEDEAYFGRVVKKGTDPWAISEQRMYFLCSDA